MEIDVDDELAACLQLAIAARNREPNHRLRALLAALEEVIHKIRNELTVELMGKAE